MENKSPSKEFFPKKLKFSRRKNTVKVKEKTYISYPHSLANFGYTRTLQSTLFQNPGGLRDGIQTFNKAGV